MYERYFEEKNQTFLLFSVCSVKRTPALISLEGLYQERKTGTINKLIRDISNQSQASFRAEFMHISCWVRKELVSACCFEKH